MEIVAKTNGGVLISGTDSEVLEILRSVNGTAPKELSIGQKIPAIDYAGSITKIKELKTSYGFTALCSSVKNFTEQMEYLRESVEKAASI
jgi:hypothetical protein